MSYVGRVYVVTGAGSGIGKATSILLVQLGAKVGLLDLKFTPETLNEIRSHIQAGGEVLPITVDVTKASAVEEAIGKVVSGLGLIDGAANLAGVMGQPTPLTSMADSEWDFLINVNLNGAKNCTRAELQRANPDGCSIVNASSVVGQRPTPNNAAYCAAKAGVIAFSKSAALEAGAVGSRVNVVVPGVIDTPLLSGWTTDKTEREEFEKKHNSMKRLGQPEEVANVVMFLLSEKASFMNGTEVNIDGGRV